MNSRIHVESGPAQVEHHPNLRRAAQEALRQAGREAVELTLVFVSDDQVRELNQQYRQKDEVTDVLSFPLGEIDPDSGLEYLGDVVISEPQARRQASTAGHPLEEELALLAIHGVLHLLDYDHTDPESKSEMWSLQDRALGALGIEMDDPAQR